MTDPKLNILEDTESPPTSAKDLQQAVAYAEEMDSIQEKLAELEECAKEFKARFDKIQLELLPDLMMAIGVSKFTMENGKVIVVSDFLRGSIPTLTQIDKAEDNIKDILILRRTAALSWLRKRNADSLIKNQVVAEFGKGQDASAKEIFTYIQTKGFKVKCEEEVNFQTLNSFLREQQKVGVTIPVVPFELFVGKKAELKKGK
jgi:hypothetical protein